MEIGRSNVANNVWKKLVRVEEYSKWQFPPEPNQLKKIN